MTFVLTFKRLALYMVNPSTKSRLPFSSCDRFGCVALVTCAAVAARGFLPPGAKVRGAPPLQSAKFTPPYNQAYINDTVTDVHNAAMLTKLGCLVASAKTAALYESRSNAPGQTPRSTPPVRRPSNATSGQKPPRSNAPPLWLNAHPLMIVR